MYVDIFSLQNPIPIEAGMTKWQSISYVENYSLQIKSRTVFSTSKYCPSLNFRETSYKVM